MPNEKNMELWNSVCKTDPAITKRVAQRGGFTALDTQSQKKRATEIWGPMGTKWGLRNCKYDYVRLGDQPVELFLEAEFFYPDGTIEISSEIAWKPGQDCRKKLRSDVIGKALAELGFNSDVYEGKFDDNKYVEQMKKEFGESDQPKQPPPAKKEMTPQQAKSAYWKALQALAAQKEIDLPTTKEAIKRLNEYIHHDAMPYLAVNLPELDAMNSGGWQQMAKYLTEQADNIELGQMALKAVETAEAPERVG